MWVKVGGRERRMDGERERMERRRERGGNGWRERKEGGREGGREER